MLRKSRPTLRRVRSPGARSLPLPDPAHRARRTRPRLPMVGEASPCRTSRRAALAVAGEARFKIGQPNIIGRSTAAANALDHAIHLRVFLIQVGQRLGLCHIDQLWLPMTDGRRPWQGRSFAPLRQPIGCRRRRSSFAGGYRWTRASAQLTRDGLCVQRRYGHSRQDSGSAQKCKFAHCRSPVSALLANAAT
jgi:hypothetical protein